MKTKLERSGLTRYEELYWMAAVRRYGRGIMVKSLLSQAQKDIINELVRKDWEYELS